jgi:hypothetical protein
MTLDHLRVSTIRKPVEDPPKRLISGLLANDKSTPLTESGITMPDTPYCYLGTSSLMKATPVQKEI